MIERLRSFATRQNSLFGATSILVATTLGSNILGLLRDRFLAQKIPTDLLDTYFAAFRIPDLVFNLLILGTVSAAFIPVFIEYRSKSDKAALEVASIVVTTSLVVILGLSALLFLVMPWLVTLVVPEFSIEKQELTASLARLMLLQPIFFGLSYLFSGILNAMKRFLIYSIVPLIYNLSIILATVFFADEFGVRAVVWGVIAGAFLHMAIQYGAMQSIGMRLVPQLNFQHPALKKIVRMMIPRSLALGSMQLMLLAFTAIASSLGAGSVAIYSLADNIQTMPTAVFGLSFTTALFPTLSELAAQKKFQQLAELVWRGLRYLAVLLVPAGIGLVLLRAQIIRLILGTGLFDWQATVNTANTLGFFALSLIAQATAVHLARTYYALHDTKTPTLVNLISYATSVALAMWFAPATGLGLGVPGLALAFSVGQFLMAGLLYFLLRSRLDGIKQLESRIGQFIGYLFVANVVLVIGVQGSKELVAAFVDMTRFWGVLIQTAVAIGIGSGTYFLVLWYFKVDELSLVTRIIQSRFMPGAKAAPIDLTDNVQPPAK